MSETVWSVRYGSVDSLDRKLLVYKVGDTS